MRNKNIYWYGLRDHLYSKATFSWPKHGQDGSCIIESAIPREGLSGLKGIHLLLELSFPPRNPVLKPVHSDSAIILMTIIIIGDNLSLNCQILSLKSNTFPK